MCSEFGKQKPPNIPKYLQKLKRVDSLPTNTFTPWGQLDP
jgi:hypothetical protein